MQQPKPKKDNDETLKKNRLYREVNLSARNSEDEDYEDDYE